MEDMDEDGEEAPDWFPEGSEGNDAADPSNPDPRVTSANVPSCMFR